LAKTLFHFFSAVGLCVGKKMKVCFVRWHKIVFKKSALAKKNKKSKRWLVGLVVSRSDIISKNVRFISVNLMLALSP